MLDVSHVLDRYRISRDSEAMATSEVGILVRDSLTPMATASHFVKDLLSINWVFDEPIYAGLVCKHIVKTCVKSRCLIDDIDAVMNDAIGYAYKFINNPNNSYMWAKLDESSDVSANHIKVVEGIDTKVAVHASGKIKKGGKQVLANDMYQKYVVNALEPLNNQGFISLLMKELDMTKAGATTYNYNQKKLYSQLLPLA